MPPVDPYDTLDLRDHKFEALETSLERISLTSGTKVSKAAARQRKPAITGVRTVNCLPTASFVHGIYAVIWSHTVAFATLGRNPHLKINPA